MTVQDWLDSRIPPPPAALRDGVRAALGNDLRADSRRTFDVCLHGAERMLSAIVIGQRFDRAGALDLLVADALTTYAYEYASSGTSLNLDAAANEGIRRFGELATAHG